MIQVLLRLVVVISDLLSSHLFSNRSPCRESVELELVGLQVQQGLAEDLDLHQQQLVFSSLLPVAHDYGALPHYGTVGVPDKERRLEE